MIIIVSVIIIYLYQLIKGEDQEKNIQSIKKIIEQRKGNKKIVRYLKLLDEFGLAEEIKNFGQEENFECTICLETFEEKKKARQIICQHIFHQECIDVWLCMNQTCPMCREDLSIKNLKNKK